MTGAVSSPQTWIDQLAEQRGFRVVAANGRTSGAKEPLFTLRLRAPDSQWRGLRSPLAVGEAWIRGDFDLEGDLFEAMRVLHDLESAIPSPLLRLLGGLRVMIRPWRSAARDIASHYDLPAEFYATFLDPGLVYTCAYFRDEDSGLERAQQDKLDLVCRKLRLGPGQRMLDLGCGWGGLACWAAAHYGVRVHAVTLSWSQATYASARVDQAGLDDRVTVEHLNYEKLPAEPRYDRIAALGVVEHIGRQRYPRYFQKVREMLDDEGLFLNHGITMRTGAPWSSEMEFLDRHVFPGLDLVDVSSTLAAVEKAGFEVLDVESLRPHYARTTREWGRRLWLNREEAVRIAGEKPWRVFVAYLAAASVAFESGWIGLAQLVAAPAGRADAGQRPKLRDELYR